METCSRSLLVQNGQRSQSLDNATVLVPEPDPGININVENTSVKMLVETKET